MDDSTTLLQEGGAALRDHGITAAITALVGGTIALLAAVTRKAFTNDAMLARFDRELIRICGLTGADSARSMQSSRNPLTGMARSTYQINATCQTGYGDSACR